MADPARITPEDAIYILRKFEAGICSTWFQIRNEERTAIAALIEQMQAVVEQAALLGRGCSCGYDHRCGNCQRIIDVKELAQRALQGG